jgi:hypothetical protein
MVPENNVLVRKRSSGINDENTSNKVMFKWQVMKLIELK